MFNSWVEYLLLRYDYDCYFKWHVVIILFKFMNVKFSAVPLCLLCSAGVVFVLADFLPPKFKVTFTIFKPALLMIKNVQVLNK